jgi:NAD(P)H-hydrate repair Nnr-like enzyme with NAD(P)H-hydrate dehydratase domain
MARGLDPFAAACAGAIAGVRAGRLAAERVGAPESVVATDVIAELPSAIRPGVE